MKPVIVVDRESIAKLKRELLLMDREAPIVISRAINHTLGKVNTEASRQVIKIYNLKARRIKQNFETRRATRGNLSGSWRSKGRPVGLIQFGAKQARRGVSVKVMASGSRSVVRGTFIRIPRNSAAAPKIERTGPQVYWRAKKQGIIVGRYPIERKAGPRVEDALSKDGVQQALQKKADIVLQDRLRHEADYLINKAR